MILDYNPLTFVFLIIVYMFSLFSSNSISHYIIHLILLILFKHFFGISILSIFKRLRPTIVFLPLMTSLYLIFSILFSLQPFSLIVEQAFKSIIKISFLLGSTALFLEMISSLRLMDAIRTQWINLNIKSRKIEDFFQLMELSLRFFPLVVSEIKILIQLDKMLGCSKPKNKMAKIIKISDLLPSLFISCLRKASQLGQAMEFRGYGNVLPRTIAKPINFGYKDGIIIILTFAFILGQLIFAKL